MKSAREELADADAAWRRAARFWHESIYKRSEGWRRGTLAERVALERGARRAEQEAREALIVAQRAAWAEEETDRG